LLQQQIETLARSRVSRLSLYQETMPSLQTALPPELANNVIRVKYHFISASIKSTLVVIIQIPDFHGFNCSFTVNVFDELNILVIK
jgi:hypothetical protein